MLSTLDTIIAFAVIMTVLSLLITIIVQMVSAAFSLRGKNLANALALTFQTVDPTIGGHAYSLAAQILRDPIFSDSVWRKKNRPATNSFHSQHRRLREQHLSPRFPAVTAAILFSVRDYTYATGSRTAGILLNQ